MIKTFITTFIIINVIVVITSQKCFININKDFAEKQPLLMTPGTNNSLLPDNTEGILKLKEQQSIELYCTEGFENLNSKLLKASCVRDNSLRVNNKEYKSKDIKCQQNSKAITKKVGKCYNDANLIHIGYEIEKRFLKLIELCFDRNTERTYYAYAKLTKANGAPQKNVDRGGWSGGKGFFSNNNVNKLYGVANQFERIKKMVGAGMAKKFINNKIFLARGHLAPKVDFVYGVHQKATMHLLNAAPQWNTINGGNWLRIEESVRDLIEDGKVEELDVYSGNYGILSVNNKEFYLTSNKEHEGVMPVPKIFFKVIVDPRTNRGVALLMTNDPFVSKNDLKKYIYCKDVKNQIKWVRPMNPDLAKGYYYACEIDDFKKKIKYLPNNINAKQLLTQ